MYLRDQGYDYENQARQRGRCGADHDVKVLPRVKRQHRSLWRNGSGNGREQCFGLIRRVMSILAFAAILFSAASEYIKYRGNLHIKYRGK